MTLASRHNCTTPVNNTDWIIVEEDTINVEDETVVTEHITIEDCIDLDTVDKLVQLLQDLIAELNYAAASNTQLGVETGAYLCGNLQELKVSSLLFPEQIGHETFYTMGEGALENFQYLEENELTILGSICNHSSLF